jgi:hypothetical protein
MSHPKVKNFYVLEGSAGDIGYFDIRAFPLSMLYYVGPVFTESLLDQAYSIRAFLSQCAHEAGSIHVAVVSLDNIGVPNATTRKKTAEYMKKDVDEVGYKCMINVISNSLFRGAMTAISWMSANEGAAPQVWAKNYEEGIGKALRMYEDAALPLPNIDARTYVFPPPEEFAQIKRGFSPP